MEGFLLYSKLAQSITENYIQKGIISEENRAVYRYGFEVLCSTIVYTLIFIIIAALSGLILPSLFFCWVFLSSENYAVDTTQKHI